MSRKSGDDGTRAVKRNAAGGYVLRVRIHTLLEAKQAGVVARSESHVHGEGEQNLH